jgi:hypothetical protein
VINTSKFSTQPVRHSLFIASLLLPLLPAGLPAAELTPASLKVWEDEVALADTRMAARLAAGAKFLSIDEDHLSGGEIVVEPAQGKGMQPVKGGALIHHWVGAAFIPNATVKDVFSVVRNYAGYQDIYRPATVKSELVRQTESEDHFFMRLSEKLLGVTGTIDGEYESKYFPAGDHRWYSVTRSTQLQQVIHLGQPDEHKLDPGEGDGYLWRPLIE